VGFCISRKYCKTSQMTASRRPKGNRLSLSENPVMPQNVELNAIGSMEHPSNPKTKAIPPNVSLP
jgi:hypothetical protein